MDQRSKNIITQFGAPPRETFQDTHALLKQVGKGEKGAFEGLWQRFLPGLQVVVAGQVWRITQSNLRGRLLAEEEDLLHQIMEKAYQNLFSFEYRGPGSLLAWLTQIARNHIKGRIAYWKARQRDPGREQARRGASTESDFQEWGLPAQMPGPVTSLILTEQRSKVAAALESLEDRYHKILFWRFFGGAGWDEIALEVGSPSADAVRMECNGKALPAFAAALAGVG